MTTIHELLDEYAAMSKDTRQKGLLFERLVRAFLSTDPLYADKYEEVWLWSDWPGRGGKVETGIDLIAQDKNGGLTAIQCKFFAPTHYLQKSDIDSFFTASGKQGFTVARERRGRLDGRNPRPRPGTVLGAEHTILSGGS